MHEMSGSGWGCECFNIKLHFTTGNLKSCRFDQHPTAEVYSLVSLKQDSGVVSVQCHNCGTVCFSVSVQENNEPLDDVFGFFQRISLTQDVTLLHVRRMDNYVTLPNYSKVYRILIQPRNVDSSSFSGDTLISAHLQSRLSDAIKKKRDQINIEISAFMKVKEEELQDWTRNAKEEAVILTERENEREQTFVPSLTQTFDVPKDLNGAEKSKKSKLRPARTSSPSKGKKKRVSFSANLPRKSSQIDTDDDMISTSSSTTSLTSNGGQIKIGPCIMVSKSALSEDEVFDFDEDVSKSHSVTQKVTRENLSPPYSLPPTPLHQRVKCKYDIEEFDNESTGEQTDQGLVTCDSMEPQQILTSRESSSSSSLARSLPISIPNHSLHPPGGCLDEAEKFKNSLSTYKRAPKIAVARSLQERMMLEDNVDLVESIYDVPNGNWRSLG